MAEMVLKGKEVVLEQAKQKRTNLEAQNREVLDQRKKFQTWTSEQQDLQKQKNVERKKEINPFLAERTAVALSTL
jgi:hypothetical protein